jgi:hypothetical protein
LITPKGLRRQVKRFDTYTTHNQKAEKHSKTVQQNRPLVLKPPTHPEMTKRMKKTVGPYPKKNPTPKLNRKYII